MHVLQTSKCQRFLLSSSLNFVWLFRKKTVLFAVLSLQLPLCVMCMRPQALSFPFLYPWKKSIENEYNSRSFIFYYSLYYHATSCVFFIHWFKVVLLPTFPKMQQLFSKWVGLFIPLIPTIFAISSANLLNKYQGISSNLPPNSTALRLKDIYVN